VPAVIEQHDAAISSCGATRWLSRLSRNRPGTLASPIRPAIDAATTPLVPREIMYGTWCTCSADAESSVAAPDTVSSQNAGRRSAVPSAAPDVGAAWGGGEGAPSGLSP
jgi:hypothetical protein